MNSIQDGHQDHEPCTIETSLHSIDLPFLGGSEPQYLNTSISGSSKVISHVESLIIERADEEEKLKSPDDMEDEKLFEIQHSFINF